MFQGKPCASTTWYEDQTLGSCGCGDGEKFVSDNYWTLTQFTAAINCMSLDPENPNESWCPANCGQCFELCSTGASTQGMTNPGGTCKVFKVTNRCGDGFEPSHPDWCSHRMSFHQCAAQPQVCKKLGNTNQFGYAAHFDLQDFHRQITKGLQWDNAEVTFERVSCDKWQGPKESTCAGCASKR